MSSQESPRSTSARTSATNTRVPLKVGLPWQIAGSATMYRPNSILSVLRFLLLLMAAIYRCRAGQARGLLFVLYRVLIHFGRNTTIPYGSTDSPKIQPQNTP